MIPSENHQVLDLIASISSRKHQICWLSNAGEGKYYVDVDVCVCVHFDHILRFMLYSFSIALLYIQYKTNDYDIYIYIVYYHIFYHISYIVSYHIYMYIGYTVSHVCIYIYIDI